MALHPHCIEDLAKSGLEPQDIGAKEAGTAEIAAVRASSSLIGYVIPYYDIEGKRIPFYRVKCVGNSELKYRQIEGTANHIYFPPNFIKVLQANKNKFKRSFIIVTEGEKKAAAACKKGFPTVALGGVNSWKSRTVLLPKLTKLSQDGKHIKAKIPSGEEAKVSDLNRAIGLQSLLDLCATDKITLIIIFDTDGENGVKYEVQQAAALFGHEAHYNGCSITQIRQLILPYISTLNKVGLDDYIQVKGANALRNQIEATLNLRNAFPRMPNIKEFLNNKLQSSKLLRSETQMIASAMLAELDARGRRIRSTNDGQPYYFDEKESKLIPAQLVNRSNEPLYEAPFGTYLYKEFGISSVDQRALAWLAAQFTGEDPVEEAEPKRVIAIPQGANWEIAIQISDSHFAIISADEEMPLKIVPNGSRGLLFEQEQVKNIPEEVILDAFEEELEKPLTSWWQKIFQEDFVLRGSATNAQLFSLIFYISPFLMHWKGTQLPVELLVGEPGSGKSSIYALRLSILTGFPDLRNIPNDIRDWYASIVSTGGLHVTDNVAFTNRDLRQRISDEICRIVTAPEPCIELRKLFTTSSQARLAVNVVFAMTAVQQPFLNTDLLQRAAVFELDAIRSGHTSDWIERKLNEHGGRIHWLAHHMVVLHKFLQLASKQWDNNYAAGHRLANYEQCLNLMSKVLSIEPPQINTEGSIIQKDTVTWIKQGLAENTQKTIQESDWTFTGLQIYTTLILKNNPTGVQISLQEITDFFASNRDYYDHPLLTSSRALMKYISNNRTSMERMLGIKDLNSSELNIAYKRYSVQPH